MTTVPDNHQDKGPSATEWSAEPSAGTGRKGAAPSSFYRMQVRAANGEERQWLADRIGCHLTADARGVLAERGERILAMVVFDWWTYNSAEAHVCVEDRSAVVPLLRAAMHYLFIETGRGIMLGRVRASHEQALRLDRGIGFEEIGRIRDGYAVGEDVVLLEMRRENCRWLRGLENGH